LELTRSAGKMRSLHFAEVYLYLVAVGVHFDESDSHFVVASHTFIGLEYELQLAVIDLADHVVTNLCDDDVAVLTVGPHLCVYYR
jgi:hypothetical protein